MALVPAVLDFPVVPVTVLAALVLVLAVLMVLARAVLDFLVVPVMVLAVLVSLVVPVTVPDGVLVMVLAVLAGILVGDLALRTGIIRVTTRRFSVQFLLLLRSSILRSATAISRVCLARIAMPTWQCVRMVRTWMATSTSNNLKLSIA
jgi:hypothetical protein